MASTIVAKRLAVWITTLFWTTFLIGSSSQLYFIQNKLGTSAKSVSLLLTPFPGCLWICCKTHSPAHIPLELHSRPSSTVRTKHLCLPFCFLLFLFWKLFTHSRSFHFILWQFTFLSSLFRRALSKSTRFPLYKSLAKPSENPNEFVKQALFSQKLCWLFPQCIIFIHVSTSSNL